MSTELPRWVVIGAVLEAALIGGFFLVPFSHLWGTLPPPPVQDQSAPSSDLSSAVTVALIFGLPSLVPFFVVTRLPWPSVVVLGSAPRALAAALVLLPALVSLSTYPCCTSDVLDYVNRQRLWVVYGENPFTLVPNDHPEDWSYYFANFKDLVFSYGPAWWLIARLFTQWATTLDQYLLGFKALALICFGISAGLVWQLAEPRARLAALAFFAWNPAVLIEGLVRLHNDLLTVPFVLGAMWLWCRSGASAESVSCDTGPGRGPSEDARPTTLSRRSARVGVGRASVRGASIALAGLSALVKVTVAPVGLVLVGACVWRRGWRELALGVAISGLIGAALYAPYWLGLQTFAPLLAQASRPQWSFGAWLLFAGVPALAVRVLLGLVCVVLVGLCLYKVRRNDEGVPDAATRAMLVVLLCLPLAFYSHYLIPLVALAAIANDSRVRALVLAVGFAAMVNAVLGVDTFAGGLAGTSLDLAGSWVLMLAVLVGIRALRLPQPASV